MQSILLSTENGLMAEMTQRDVNWGTGVDLHDDATKDPSRWEGTNILGWALMETRAALRSGWG